jgi:hypothetical protein
MGLMFQEEEAAPHTSMARMRRNIHAMERVFYLPGTSDSLTCHASDCLVKCANVLWKLAGSTGLEPAASAVTGLRSRLLNYDP